MCTNVVFTNSGGFSPATIRGPCWRSAPMRCCFPSTTHESSAAAVAGREGTTLSASDRDKVTHGNAERQVAAMPSRLES